MPEKSFSLDLQSRGKNPREFLSDLPCSPGVYIMKGVNGEILYIGKAGRLSNRVRSYFTGFDSLAPKVKALVRKAITLEVILTSTEAEALLLEANLVKTYRPHYNIYLKDDKKFPFIKITSEQFPRIVMVRERVKDGARYFGPYVSAGGLRALIGHLRATFFIRTCVGSNPGKGAGGRECLEYHINRCKAPCTGRMSEKEYGKNVEAAKILLSGRVGQLLDQLNQDMAAASESLLFEKAARLRDRIQGLRKLAGKQRVVGKTDEDFDVAAVEVASGTAVVLVLEVREGRVLGRGGYTLSRPSEETPAEVLSSFLMQHYPGLSYIPPCIYVSVDLDETADLKAILGDERGGKVEIRHPKRGDKAGLSRMAVANAGLLLEGIPAGEDNSPIIRELQTLLALRKPPSLVEAFDISNLQGEYSVGSMVSFREGRPWKKGYRRFKIKRVEGQDDFAMMYETVLRRYRRIAGEGTEPPDLVLVDGGKGQLASASRAISRSGLSVPIDIAAIAKREEEIFLPGKSEPVLLPRGSAALRLVQRIRNEAHRFAVTYHRSLRGKSIKKSALDAIPGVGSVIKERLFKRFGSLSGIKNASVEELCGVKGIGKDLAARIDASLG